MLAAGRLVVETFWGPPLAQEAEIAVLCVAVVERERIGRAAVQVMNHRGLASAR
jgi:hypothetical protein